MQCCNKCVNTGLVKLPLHSAVKTTSVLNVAFHVTLCIAQITCVVTWARMLSNNLHLYFKFSVSYGKTFTLQLVGSIVFLSTDL